MATPNPRPGLPLIFRFNVFAYDGGTCTPLPARRSTSGIATASGYYSGVQAGMGNPNTVGQNFLRGYQVTDAAGLVELTTIYPGWYSGRAVHIHVKVRMFDAASNTHDGSDDAAVLRRQPSAMRCSRQPRRTTRAGRATRATPPT